MSIETAAGGSRRLAARLLHADDQDLRVFGVDDRRMADDLRMAAWDVLGDPGGVEARDTVHVTACQAGAIQHARSRPVVIAQRGDIAFHGTGLEDSATGGPLVHVVGSEAMLVGLLVSVRERADGRSIDAIAQTLREWKVPVALRRRGTLPGCSYEVRFSKDAPKTRGRSLLMLGSNADSAVATVETAADCPWTAYGSGVSWLGVAGGQTGPGSVTIRAMRGNMCDGRFREGFAYIAGRLYRVGQDGTAMGMGC